MKIETLTKEQQALIPHVRDEWIKICLDTAPVDRMKVRAILARLYAIPNKPAPKNIIHLDSPLQLSNTVANMRLESIQNFHDVSPEVSGQVSYDLRIKIHQQVLSPGMDKINSNDQFSQISKKVRTQVEDQISAPVSFQAQEVHRQARNAIEDQSLVAIRAEFLTDFGQGDHLLPSCDFYGRIGIDVSKLEPAFDLAKNCGWSVLFWDWAFISAKPERIRRDEQFRLHCENGPALSYPDGFSVFAIHGVRVPKNVAIAPATITLYEIVSQRNAEVRRVMIERYGLEPYLMDSGADEIHRDDFGILSHISQISFTSRS